MVEYEDYDVYAVMEGISECVGAIELPENASFSDMPKELEINGFTYKIEGGE